MAQAAVALLGFVAILIQINEIRTNNRTSSARAGVSGLHRSGVQESEIRAAGLRDDQGRRPRRAGPVRELRLVLPLRLRGNDLSAFADKREWLASCDYDLKPHLPFLCEKNAAQPAYLATYGAETQQWIKTSLKTASVTPPDCKLGKT